MATARPRQRVTMGDTNVLLDALSGFARDLTGRGDAGDMLRDLTERATDALDLAGAAVTLVRAGEMSFAVSPSEVVADLERVQERHQAGPCAVAATTGHVITIRDLAEGRYADDWPEYTAHAQQVGIRAVAAIPMLADGEPLGVVDLYSAPPRDWNPHDLQAAVILVDIASSHLARAVELQQQRRTAEQLQRALDSRIVIEQAKGMLAAAHGISVDDAFKILRKHARDHNARLHDVAAAVVNLGMRL